MSGTLVLVRHGQSEWNLKNLFTGWRDVDLSEKGVEEAKAAGQKLRARGLNKDDARKKWGEEQVHVWRRSYDTPPPGGESLKDTGARVWPYYMHDMQPHVLRGGTVLVAAHGNSLRALIMALDGKSGEEIVRLELGTGVPVI